MLYIFENMIHIVCSVYHRGKREVCVKGGEGGHRAILRLVKWEYYRDNILKVNPRNELCP